MPVLTVRRDRAFRDRRRRYRVLLDGDPVGELAAGEQLQCDLGPGPHVLTAHIDWCGSQPLGLDGDGGDVEVEVSNSLRGLRLLLAAWYVAFAGRDYLTLRVVLPVAAKT